jgi:nucleoid-associated protein YgaU
MMMGCVARRVTAVLFVALVAASGCGEGPPARKQVILPGKHVVTSGEGLSHIALKAYGDFNLWPALLHANPEVAKRPGLELIEGEEIVVPARAELKDVPFKGTYPRELPADYVVLPGDSLHLIAKGSYGDEELWKQIYDANREKLSERVKEDTRRLTPGQVLRIPERKSGGQGAGSGEQEAKGGENRPTQATGEKE